MAELTVRADTPPSPLGGEIAAGTYVLTDVSRFTPGGQTQNDEDGGGAGAPGSSTLTSKSLVIAGNTYRLAEWTGTDPQPSGAPVLSGGTFTITGTSVTFTQSCPEASSHMIGFSVVGPSIALYPTNDRRETYVMR